MSQAGACSSQANACPYCMHCPITSQADACSYCMGSVVLNSSQICLYLQLLCYPPFPLPSPYKRNLPSWGCWGWMFWWHCWWRLGQWSPKKWRFVSIKMWAPRHSAWRHFASWHSVWTKMRHYVNYICAEFPYTQCHYCACSCKSFDMKSVIMLAVIILNVVAPLMNSQNFLRKT
jgi:hypothetical protein